MSTSGRDTPDGRAGTTVAEDARFTALERAAIAAAVAKIAAGTEAERAERRFEDDPAAFLAVLRASAARAQS